MASTSRTRNTCPLRTTRSHRKCHQRNCVAKLLSFAGADCNPQRIMKEPSGSPQTSQNVLRYPKCSVSETRPTPATNETARVVRKFREKRLMPIVYICRWLLAHKPPLTTLLSDPNQSTPSPSLVRLCPSASVAERPGQGDA